MAELVMPRLSDTMEEGTILRWLKANGERVARGEELVEIETDKATMTYESDQEGILEILAEPGSTLAVGETIARVGVPGAAEQPSPTRTSEDEIDEPAPDGPAGGGAHGGLAGENGSPAPSPAGGGGARATPMPGARIRASPLARRMAREGGIDLGGIAGSGPGGRIVKADVSAASEGEAVVAPSTPSLPAAPATASADLPSEGVPARASVEGVARAKGQTTVVGLSRTQQAVARRMAESKATIPDFALEMEVDMEECLDLRAQLKRLAGPGGSQGAARRRHDVPTFNDMAVKASALALREHPTANGSYRDGAVHSHSRVNVGIAVAAQESLVVPTVFDADEKSLGEIAREARALAGRVRDGTITPPELGGGTFTVSNLGMFGVSSFTAIVNPPQAAILAVGAVERRAVVADGERKRKGKGEPRIVARHRMTLTLVSDHRILYGAEAARFLARIRELLESPSSLTL